MTSKAQARREALARWWDRGPWPCVLLAIDPGKVSGVAIVLSRPGGMKLLQARVVDLHRDRGVEVAVENAVLASREHDLPLVLVLEDWGRGGPRGLAQWVGLGEARGPWRREFLIRAGEEADLVKSRVVLATQSRWRSRVVPETGATEGEKWRPFTPEEWKAAAREAAQRHFLDAYVPPLDAAEAVCVAVYAARSDEVLSKIPKRVLDAHGVSAEDREALEKVITPRRAKRADTGKEGGAT